jgi:hypothetical protein
MGLSDRLETIKTLADYVVSLPEQEADGALSSSGIGVTPSGWEDWDHDRKYRAVRSMLASADEEAYERLISWAYLAGDSLPSLPVPEGVELLPSQPPLSVTEETRGGALAAVEPEGPIFVVHGHANALRHELVRVLERATSRDVVVLHEQANEGRTILEKFEDHAASAAYAVVLLTDDDQGTAGSSSSPQPRGRQNVVFELGFFFGKLGRRRVAVLLEAGVERPSDIDGLVYVPLDSGGSWKYALARELASVGIEADLSRIP